MKQKVKWDFGSVPWDVVICLHKCLGTAHHPNGPRWVIVGFSGHNTHPVGPGKSEVSPKELAAGPVLGRGEEQVALTSPPKAIPHSPGAHPRSVPGTSVLVSQAPWGH